MKTIRIGPIDYEYALVEGLRNGNDKINGQISYNDCCVEIEACLSDQAKRQTLWHEIIHGILTHAGIKSDEKEDLCEAISFGVMAVLRDNPELRDFEHVALVRYTGDGDGN